MKDLGLKRLGVIGAGKMGAMLIDAWVSGGAISADAVVATAKTKGRRDHLRNKHSVTVSDDNRAAVRDADVVLLAVKPQIAPDVLAELGEVMNENQVLWSIIAGLSTRETEEALGRDGIPVVRAMPNTPSRVGCGMTVLCGGRWATQEHLDVAWDHFNRLGNALTLDEKHFDAVTGLSASGPAFIYIVIEALAEGGVKVGLPRDVATTLAAQTCLGAGKMVLETGDHPARLKDEVTTPAGCTMDGILKLEEGGLRVTLIKAVVEARNRAAGLVEG